MIVVTVLAGISGFIVGLAIMGIYLKRKYSKQLDLLKGLSQDKLQTFNIHTLKSEGSDSPEKEGDRPIKQDSAITQSPDSTLVAPSSNTPEIELIKKTMAEDIPVQPVPQIEPKEEVEDPEVIKIREKAEKEIKELEEQRQKIKGDLKVKEIEDEEKKAIKKIKKEMADKKKALEK